MIEVVLGVRVVIIARCKDRYGIDVAVCAGFGEGVEGGCRCGFDGGIHPVGRDEGLSHGATWLHCRYRVLLML